MGPFLIFHRMSRKRVHWVKSPGWYLNTIILKHILLKVEVFWYISIFWGKKTRYALCANAIAILMVVPFFWRVWLKCHNTLWPITSLGMNGLKLNFILIFELLPLLNTYCVKINKPQCGRFGIFLSIRFYQKSILENL